MPDWPSRRGRLGQQAPGSCRFAPDIGHPPIDYTARVCNSERRDRGPPTRAKPDMPVDRKREIELIVGVLFVLVRMLCLFFLLLMSPQKTVSSFNNTKVSFFFSNQLHRRLPRCVEDRCRSVPTRSKSRLAARERAHCNVQ